MADLSKDELKVLVNIVWDSLRDPSWTKDDLIEFGKAIYTDQPLSKLDEKLFERAFPSLVTITKGLAQRLQDIPSGKEEKKEENKELGKKNEEEEKEKEKEE